MGRDAHADLVASFGNATVRPFFAVKLIFPDADGDDVEHRFWTGLGDKTILSATYAGAGDLLTISSTEENSDLAAKGITIALKTTNEFILTMRERPYQGNPITVYLGALNAYGGVVQQPFVYFDGFIDQLAYTISATEAEIELTAEHRLLRVQKANGRKLTYQDHQMDTTNGLTFEEGTSDAGLSFITRIAEQELSWGS